MGTRLLTSTQDRNTKHIQIMSKSTSASLLTIAFGFVLGILLVSLLKNIVHPPKPEPAYRDLVHQWKDAPTQITFRSIEREVGTVSECREHYTVYEILKNSSHIMGIPLTEQHLRSPEIGDNRILAIKAIVFTLGNESYEFPTEQAVAGILQVLVKKF